MGKFISKLSIQGFKSIKSLDLDMKPINVLIGANGAGKSNFISFFKLLNNLIKSELQEYVQIKGGAEGFLFYGSKSTEIIKSNVEFGKNAYCLELKASAKDSLVVSEEKAKFFGHANPEYTLRWGNVKETQIITSTEPVAAHVRDSLNDWIVYQFHDTSDSARVKKKSQLVDSRSLAYDAGNLAAFLFSLKQNNPKNYQSIRDTIQLVAPFFGDFILEPTPPRKKDIMLLWKEKGSSIVFGPDQLSDGTLRFICLTTLLLQPELPSTIIIDEPELGLHPYAIELLVSMIQSAAKKTQLVISTQSTLLIDKFQPEDIVVVDRERDPDDKAHFQSVFKRLSNEGLKNWIDEYTIGELWEKNVFGGRPN